MCNFIFVSFKRNPKNYKNISSEILTAVTMKIIMMSELATCSLVGRY
jgi:hypothetical protein